MSRLVRAIDELGYPRTYFPLFTPLDTKNQLQYKQKLFNLESKDTMYNQLFIPCGLVTLT